MKLLSYEDGFSWCVACKHVSTISATSELKIKGLRGCQRRSCQRCIQWRHQSPYEDGDFLFEGDKEHKDCPWYVSGKGCKDGNKCIHNHPKWDEKLPENKGRCYVCGQQRDHHSRYCDRPGGGAEFQGFKEIEDKIPMFMPLPRRPNGEEPVIPQRQEDPRRSRTNQGDERRFAVRLEEETPEEKRFRQCTIVIYQARRELPRFGTVTDDLGNLIKALAEQPGDFKGKNEILDLTKEIQIEERINAVQREIEARRAAELIERIEQCQDPTNPQGGQSSSSGQQGPSIRAVKIVKLEVEEEEEDPLTFAKRFIAAVGTQIVLQWLYGKCRKRFQE